MWTCRCSFDVFFTDSDSTVNRSGNISPFLQWSSYGYTSTFMLHIQWPDLIVSYHWEYFDRNTSTLNWVWNVALLLFLDCFNCTRMFAQLDSARVPKMCPVQSAHLSFYHVSITEIILNSSICTVVGNQVGDDQASWENWYRWVSSGLLPTDECRMEKCSCLWIPVLADIPSTAVNIHGNVFNRVSSTGTWVSTEIIHRTPQMLCTSRDKADCSCPEGWGQTSRGALLHFWGHSLNLCRHQPSLLEWSDVQPAPGHHYPAYDIRYTTRNSITDFDTVLPTV